MGHAVEIAEDGQETLTKLGVTVDLLFSDPVMPGGLDGVSLARDAQRRHPDRRELTICPGTEGRTRLPQAYPGQPRLRICFVAFARVSLDMLGLVR